MAIKKDDKKEVISLEFFTPEQVSMTIGITVGTLANWRTQRKGPAYCKTPRIYYEKKVLYRWMKKREIEPEGMNYE